MMVGDEWRTHLHLLLAQGRSRVRHHPAQQVAKGKSLHVASVVSWTRRPNKNGSAATRSASGLLCMSVAKASSISRPSLALTTSVCTPTLEAVSITSLSQLSITEFFGLTSTPTCAAE